ncbi:snaclec agglucetin subunit beta-1-like [Simochromis diagramma]|uniref:snaclec agglucetin subunit beta-1-like n=1 Tax=Simochromis diagramma TaxID=43689 RepID=UPI001A7F02BC|nr:snaclec agglucetin subunit beta-1-like [Simochromis diagramma]
MRVFFLLCAGVALCITTANPVPDMKQESPLELIPAQQNRTDEMKRGQPLQKAGRTAVGKEGFAEPPNQHGGKCPPEFQEHRGRCFGFFRFPLAWIDAEEYCWPFTNLASIHGQDEYDFVMNLMNEMGYHGPAWIGASDAVRFGNWLWSDGSVSMPFPPYLLNDWNKWGRCLTIGLNGNVTKSSDCRNA